MPEPDPMEPEDEPGADVSPVTLRILERTDTLAHIVVAIFFLLMAITVLIDTGIVFVRQMPLIYQSMTGKPAASSHPAVAKVEPKSTEPAAETHKPGETPAESHKAESEAAGAQHGKEADSGDEVLAHREADPFTKSSLELLRTIITYLQTRNTQAIMKEFIVVGIISSVRKILLVGAESSMAHTTGMEFIHESLGTVITIGGILMLIFGLIVLRRAYGVPALSLKAVLIGEGEEEKSARNGNPSE